MSKNSGPSWWKRAAIIVPVVSATAIAVPFIMNLDSKETSAETLGEVARPTETAAPTTEVAASPVVEQDPPPSETEDSAPAEVTTPAEEPAGAPYGEPIGTVMPWSWYDDDFGWYLPVSAPLETFPFDPTHDYEVGCTPEQVAWLRAHARPLETMYAFYVTLQNTASEGGALSLGNVRFEGEEVATEPGIAFDCRVSESGGLIGTSAVILHPDGRFATWGWANDDDPSTPVEGSPVVLNLAPGEVAELYFERHPETDEYRLYSGHIVADVINEEGTTVTLAKADFIPETLLGYTFGYVYDYDLEDWKFVCVTPDSEPGWAECSPSEAAAALVRVAEDLS